MRSEVRTCGLTDRELTLTLGALSSQLRYVRSLARKNRDPEAEGRNRLNALELDLLIEKLRKETGHGDS